MKINWDIKYTTMAVYTSIVIILSIMFYLIASEVNLFTVQVSKYLRTFQPIIIGFVMAYLFNFILEFLEKYVVDRISRNKLNKNLKRVISMLVTYILVFFIVYTFLYFILPQLITSLIGLGNGLPGYISQVSRIVIDTSSKFVLNDEIYRIVVEKWNEFVNYVISFATGLVPILGYLVRGIISSVWNIVLGTIVSIYLLFEKEKFMALCKKITISLFTKERADRIIELTKRGDNIFGRFLSGKILDSTIIAFITFIVLTISNMPYVTLISFIVGVSNIIPFFGPLIGAIPSFFIILFVSPIKALWFLLIVVLIQQLDGNIIGPKILGDSLGISPFWILFSLLIAGKLLGFIGLIIGVPLFVFIYSIVKDFIEARLEKKGLPVATKEYYKEKGLKN